MMYVNLHAYDGGMMWTCTGTMWTCTHAGHPVYGHVVTVIMSCDMVSIVPTPMHHICGYGGVLEMLVSIYTMESSYDQVVVPWLGELQILRLISPASNTCEQLASSSLP